MELLSDEVLVMMLGYLDVPSLLSCRLVSKRLSALVADPSVWRHRAVVFSKLKKKRFLCALLRLAPCLDSLRLPLAWFAELKCGFSFATTRCAVSRLSLYLSGSRDPLQASLIIRNQEALGRLKTLEVRCNDVLVHEVAVLLATVLTTSGLERLSVTGLPDCRRTLARLDKHHLAEPVSRLSYFTCELDSESFCNFILAKHAATLVEVDLLTGVRDKGSDPPPLSSLTSTAALLSGLPNLRKLKCRMLPGLEAVAACASLADLSLAVRPEDRAGLQGAEALLRRATQLRAVTLVYNRLKHCPQHHDVGANLFLALAAGQPSRVETLTILNGESGKYFPQLRSLLKALRVLPALRRLEVETAPDELLLSITPATAPTLETLIVRSADQEPWKSAMMSGPCVHTWLHTDAVQTLLSVNPSLQLVVPATLVFNCEIPSEETCSSGCRESLCHPLLRDRWQLLSARRYTHNSEQMVTLRDIPE